MHFAAPASRGGPRTAVRGAAKCMISDRRVSSTRGWSAVSARALDAAGITDPELRAAFEQCRRLHAAHGRAYYLATLRLPPAKRPYVWSLPGFARPARQ